MSSPLAPPQASPSGVVTRRMRRQAEQQGEERHKQQLGESPLAGQGLAEHASVEPMETETVRVQHYI